jgi:hypothetical protein
MDHKLRTNTIWFINMRGDDYKQATEVFWRVSGEEKNIKKNCPIIGDMNFKLEYFQKQLFRFQKQWLSQQL